MFSVDNVSIKEVTGDRARLNYEIEGGLVNTKPSLLLEPQSTNFFLIQKIILCLPLHQMEQEQTL